MAAVVVVGLPTTHELPKVGGATKGLRPPLSSSVAPSGMVPADTVLPVTPSSDDVDNVPEAVPVEAPTLQEAVGLVLTPAASNVELELFPTLEHELVLAVGSNGAGLRPPGESSLAPSGIPTGPTGDVTLVSAPGIPRGDVAPMAGEITVSGAI